MKTKTKQHTADSELFTAKPGEEALELLSAQELEEVLFEEADKAVSGPLNLPTVAGVSLITIGIVYVLTLLGVVPWALGGLASVLPWVGSALVLLLGLGTLGRRSKIKRRRRRKKRRRDMRHAAKLGKAPLSSASNAETLDGTAATGKPARRRLCKSRQKKILGVAGGIAEYFGIDPTLTRIGMLLLASATIPTGGWGFVVYFVMAWVMVSPDRAAVPESTEKKER